MKAYVWPIFLGLVVNLVVNIVFAFLQILLEVGILRVSLVSDAHYALSITLGFLGVILAGYITSRSSASHKFLNTSILGSIFLIQTIHFALTTLSTAPWWFHAIGIITCIPATLLGAYIDQRKTA
jgi:hypothetical protein